MRPWQINILIIFGMFVLIFLKVPNFIIWIIILASAVWVYTDAKKLEIGKYKVSFLGGRGPVSYAIGVAVLWLIAFPAYISIRRKVIEGKWPLKKVKQTEKA